ncbi:MAG: alpha-galactosidase [Solirubrobacterales bacterium]|nr:alpha-galactosidase [Solirubrobacterales bacterium]
MLAPCAGLLDDPDHVLAHLELLLQRQSIHAAPDQRARSGAADAAGVRHPPLRTRRRPVWLVALCLWVTALAGFAPAAAAEQNGLSARPPMGWNDWYAAYCGVNAQLIEQTAQTMVSNGMKAAGYQYVNIDDCWMAPSRDSAGNLVADPTRFPDGIKPVADYVHNLGLKLGIYEDAGTTTCAHLPGSYGHEAQDAATFASWGVDYLKYDRCSIPFGDFPGQSEQQVQQTLNTRMSNALKATGRPIVFSICNPDPGDDPWRWGAPIANLWRTTPDIEDNFGSMLVNFEGTVNLFSDAGPGAWNDPDMLQIGNGGSTRPEYRTEFSLWAEMAAPLIASTNLAALSPQALAIYENAGVIAVDQDPLGKQGVPISSQGGRWVLSKELSGGDRAVVLFNSTDTAATIATRAIAVGLRAARAYRLEDLWSNSVSESRGPISAFVPAHSVVMYRVAAIDRRRARALAPHIVLSLAAAVPQLFSGRSTIVRETLSDDGLAPVKRVKLTFRVGLGWRIKRLGRARVKRLAAGQRYTVAFRVTAPVSGPPSELGGLSGGASWDPLDGWRATAAFLGERVLAPVPPPYQTADITRQPAAFAARDGAFAISARGTGVLQPWNAPPTGSYAAIYERQRAGASSTAQVAVSYDAAGGSAGGAGLIERDAMTAPAGSPAGVVLFVNGAGTVVMSWNATGGRDVDSRFAVPGVVAGPVTLRLVRSGSSYTGYYSTNGGVTWAPVDTVTVAAGASAGNQDVGVFHASGLPTWTTTATFRDFSVR